MASNFLFVFQILIEQARKITSMQMGSSQSLSYVRLGIQSSLGKRGKKSEWIFRHLIWGY